MHKFSMIMYPYFVWSLITGGLQIALSNYVNSKIIFYDLLRIYYCPLPEQHYWFLYTLFLMYLSYVFCNSLFRSIFHYVFLFISIVVYFSNIHTNVRIFDKYFYNVIFFALGIFLSKNVLIIKRFSDISISRFFVIVIMLAFLGCEIGYMLTYGNFKSLAFRLIFAILGIATVITLAKFLSVNGYFFTLIKVGQCSLYIYLAHGLFGSGARILLNKIFLVENPIVHVVVGVIAGTVFPIILYEWSKRNYASLLFKPPSLLKV